MFTQFTHENTNDFDFGSFLNKFLIVNFDIHNNKKKKTISLFIGVREIRKIYKALKPSKSGGYRPILQSNYCNATGVEH